MYVCVHPKIICTFQFCDSMIIHFINYKYYKYFFFFFFTLPLLNNQKKDSIPQKKRTNTSQTIPIRICMMNTLSAIREPIAHFFIYIIFLSYKAFDKLNNLKTKSRFMSQLLSANGTEKFYNV